MQFNIAYETYRTLTIKMNGKTFPLYMVESFAKELQCYSITNRMRLRRGDFEVAHVLKTQGILCMSKSGSEVWPGEDLEDFINMIDLERDRIVGSFQGSNV